MCLVLHVVFGHTRHEPGREMQSTALLMLAAPWVRSHHGAFCCREPFSREGAEPVRINGLNKRIALDLARGVAFLHSRNIVHFDVKVRELGLGFRG